MIQKKIILVIQMSMMSKRLPQKMLLPLNNHSLYQFVLQSALQAHHKIPNSSILIQTTKSLKELALIDDIISYMADKIDVWKWAIAQHGKKNTIYDFSFLPPLNSTDTIIRLTGDNPFIPPSLIVDIVHQHLTDKAAITVTRTDQLPHIKYSYPPGLDIEVFSYQSLQSRHFSIKGIYNYHWMFSRLYTSPYTYPPSISLTLDTPRDYADLNRFCTAHNLIPGTLQTESQLLDLIQKEESAIPIPQVSS